MHELALDLLLVVGLLKHFDRLERVRLERVDQFAVGLIVQIGIQRVARLLVIIHSRAVVVIVACITRFAAQTSIISRISTVIANSSRVQRHISVVGHFYFG